LGFNLEEHGFDRTAIVAFYRVYPPDSGAASVSYNTARYLPGEKYLFALNSQSSQIELEAGLRLVTFACPFSNHVSKTLALARQMIRIASSIKKMRPSRIVLEGASWSLYYLIFCGILRLFNIHAMVIYHAHNVEYLLRKKRNGPLIAGLTRWAEGALLKLCDIVTATSEIDAQLFKQGYGIRTLLLPNGADTVRFSGIGPEQIARVKRKYSLNGKTVLFMGLTDYPPNNEAILFMANEVFPRLLDLVHDIRFVVIGGHVENKKPWMINPGSIPYEDVPAVVRACHICVAPIFSGSGTRLKILEYMAAGKAVVSTTKGAEGIAATNGKDILLADDADSFASEIASLLGNIRKAHRIAAQGQRTVREKYSWPSIMSGFLRSLKQCEKL
jgi:glycosyltransferase involved in cell wall biosynthesis